MPEDRDGLLEHFRTGRAGLLQAIEGLTAGQMTDPTIDGWSVTDHLLHLATWDEIRAAEVERVSAGFDSAWRMTEEQERWFNQTAYEVRRGLSAAQARWELEATRAKLLGAIATATERGLDGARYAAAALKSGHELEHAGWISRWRRERGI